MSAKHTPGPWELDDLGNVCSQAVHNIALVFSSSTREGWSGSDYDTQAHCEANARLIASAPELLAFVQEFLADYQSLEGMASMKYYAGKAHSAIAKATGSEE